MKGDSFSHLISVETDAGTKNKNEQLARLKFFSSYQEKISALSDRVLVQIYFQMKLIVSLYLVYHFFSSSLSLLHHRIEFPSTFESVRASRLPLS